jgi:hypothetical protein
MRRRPDTTTSSSIIFWLLGRTQDVVFLHRRRHHTHRRIGVIKNTWFIRVLHFLQHILYTYETKREIQNMLVVLTLY